MTAYIRGYSPPCYWNLDGVLSAFALNIFLDGVRGADVGLRAKALVISQRVDGTAGTTTIELFKKSPGGVETSMGTVSLAFGSGTDSQAQFTAFASAAIRRIDPGYRLGIKLTAVQTGGEDLSIGVFFGGP